MKEAITARLAELRREMAAGEQLLERLNRQLADTQQVLLRISGAIQVLEEVLAGSAADEAAAPAAPEDAHE